MQSGGVTRGDVASSLDHVCFFIPGVSVIPRAGPVLFRNLKVNDIGQ